MAPLPTTSAFEALQQCHYGSMQNLRISEQAQSDYRPTKMESTTPSAAGNDIWTVLREQRDKSQDISSQHRKHHHPIPSSCRDRLHRAGSHRTRTHLIYRHCTHMLYCPHWLKIVSGLLKGSEKLVFTSFASTIQTHTRLPTTSTPYRHPRWSDTYTHIAVGYRMSERVACSPSPR